MTILKQCELLGLPRSTYYYQPRPESTENLRLLRELDQLYRERPFYGSRKMAVVLAVNRKRIQRLMRIPGIEAHYPKPNLSRPAPGHQLYPYLLRDVPILRPNQVWSTDITYIPMRGGFLYLVAVMDWFSRFVLSWELSNTMETGFCLAALDAAFGFGQPEIWNSDQGAQFTSVDFLAPLKERGIAISMDGRGRALDNVFIERLWRSLKYERNDLPRRLRQRPRPLAGAGGLLPLLQPRASSSGARLSHTGGSISALNHKEKIVAMMEAPPPTPRDLPHYRQDSWGQKREPGSGVAPLPVNPGTESALGAHPCVALSSAQPNLSLDQSANLCHPVVGHTPLVELRTTPKSVQPMGSTSET